MVIAINDIGSYSELGGLFELSKHVCMEETYKVTVRGLQSPYPPLPMLIQYALLKAVQVHNIFCLCQLHNGDLVYIGVMQSL